MKDILVHLILSLVNFLLKRVHKLEISPLRTDQNEALPALSFKLCSTRISHKVVKNGVDKLREYSCFKTSSGLIK
jgi:hypothetical protein